MYYPAQNMFKYYDREFNLYLRSLKLCMHLLNSFLFTICKLVSEKCYFLLNFARLCVFCGSFFVICYGVCLSYCLVCSLQLCSHLLGKGCHLCSFVCDFFLCLFHFPILICQVCNLIVSIPNLCLLSYYVYIA